MKTVSIQQFVKLRRELSEEQGRLVARLRDINEALGEIPLPSLSPIQGATASDPDQSARRGRRPGGGQSLRDHVIAVLQEGPKSKEEVLASVEKRGYRFSTKNPLNSLGVILYGKNPRFDRANGKFLLGGSRIGNGFKTEDSRTNGRRRRMSASARARIAAAQRARWAKQKAGTNAEKSVSYESTQKPKRKMSAAARKALAAAARKRWAAAKAAGKSRL